MRKQSTPSRHLSVSVANDRTAAAVGIDGQSAHTIAHVLPFPSVGGTEHATIRVAKSVDAARFSSIAFCLAEAEPVRALFANSAIPCVTYEPPVPSYRHAPSFLRSSLALAQQFRRHGVDLVHCADLEAAHQVAVAGWLARLPVLCHIRNRFDDISLRDRSFLFPVAKFVFVSRDTWRRFAYSVSPHRGVVVYDGIEEDVATAAENDAEGVRSEFNIPADAPLVGMMARVAPQKDFATLARAAARILEVEPNTRFLIAGDCASAKNSAHYEEVRADLHACGVESAFIFTGLRSDVPRLMSALDVFVLSTHCEGFPLVILEAMACAKPVVATAVDGIPEIIQDGQTGLLYAHEDHESLATEVLGLLRDRSRAQRLGRAGRNLVRSAFNSRQFAASMNAVYEGLLRTDPGKVRAAESHLDSLPSARGPSPAAWPRGRF